jgi:hypothetical protein
MHRRQLISKKPGNAGLWRWVELVLSAQIVFFNLVVEVASLYVQHLRCFRYVPGKLFQFVFNEKFLNVLFKILKLIVLFKQIGWCVFSLCIGYKVRTSTSVIFGQRE